MKKYYSYCVLLVIAEVLASFAVWHGTPTDWTGERLRFWEYEGFRLGYWAIFLLLFGVLWVGMQRLLSQRLGRNVLAAACSGGIEVVTSLASWKRLPTNQTVYLGWPNVTKYVLEHLVAWALFWVLGLVLWHLLGRVVSKQSVDTMERKA